jgi:hypothetical protein
VRSIKKLKKKNKFFLLNLYIIGLYQILTSITATKTNIFLKE